MFTFNNYLIDTVELAWVLSTRLKMSVFMPTHGTQQGSERQKQPKIWFEHQFQGFFCWWIRNCGITPTAVCYLRAWLNRHILKKPKLRELWIHLATLTLTEWFVIDWPGITLQLYRRWLYPYNMLLDIWISHGISRLQQPQTPHHRQLLNLHLLRPSRLHFLTHSGHSLSRFRHVYSQRLVCKLC